MTGLEDQLNQMRSERDAYKIERDWFRETLIERTKQLRAARSCLIVVEALCDEQDRLIQRKGYRDGCMGHISVDAIRAVLDAER